MFAGNLLKFGFSVVLVSFSAQISVSVQNRKPGDTTDEVAAIIQGMPTFSALAWAQTERDYNRVASAAEDGAKALYPYKTDEIRRALLLCESRLDPKSSEHKRYAASLRSRHSEWREKEVHDRILMGFDSGSSLCQAFWIVRFLYNAPKEEKVVLGREQLDVWGYEPAITSKNGKNYIDRLYPLDLDKKGRPYVLKGLKLFVPEGAPPGWRECSTTMRITIHAGRSGGSESL